MIGASRANPASAVVPHVATDYSVSSLCRGNHGQHGPLPTALEGSVVGRGTKRKSEEDITMTEFFKNSNKDKIRSAQLEFDIRFEELALAREQAQRQFDASMQQNQMMMTMMQFMMECQGGKEADATSDDVVVAADDVVVATNKDAVDIVEKVDNSQVARKEKVTTENVDSSDSSETKLTKQINQTISTLGRTTRARLLTLPPQDVIISNHNPEGFANKRKVVQEIKSK